MATRERREPGRGAWGARQLRYLLTAAFRIGRMRQDHFFSAASDDQGRWGTAAICSQNQPRGEAVTGVRLLAASVGASALQRFPVVPYSRSCWWPIHSHLWLLVLERFPGANENNLAGGCQMELCAESSCKADAAILRQTSGLVVAEFATRVPVAK